MSNQPTITRSIQLERLTGKAVKLLCELSVNDGDMYKQQIDEVVKEYCDLTGKKYRWFKDSICEVGEK